jgi:hypothetical protein
MANTRVRVGGSGFTVFQWKDASGTHIIGFAQNVTVNPVQPVAAPEVIQPLNAQRPLEIVTPGAHTNGTITLTLTELYNEAVWQRMSILARSQDIVDIMRTLAAQQSGVTITKTIRPGHLPVGSGQYAETYFGVVVASVEDNGETLDVTTMSINKTMTLMYTHSKKNWINGGDYAWPRDVRTG